MENSMIIAIDLGTSESRIVAATPAQDMPYGLNILCSEDMESRGIKRGSVCNKDEAGKVLNNLLLAIAKKVPSQKSQRKVVLVNFGGMNYRSAVKKQDMPLNGMTVTTDTLVKIEKRAIEDMKGYLDENEKLLRTTAISYSIDDEPSTDDVRNRSGNSLEAKYLCICGKKKAVTAINSALPQKAQPAAMYPTASSKAAIILSPDQRRNGVALVDIGGGTTSVAVFYRDSLIYEVTVPFGSDNVTNDIAEGLDVSVSDAEHIKRNIGILDENSASKLYRVTLPSGEIAEFSGAKLNFIIRARVEEIVPYIEKAIAEAKKVKSPENGIRLALTGGGAKLKGLNKILTDKTGLSLTNTSTVSAENVDFGKAADYACAIGMASIWARENRDSQKEQPTLPFPDEQGKNKPAVDATPASQNPSQPAANTNAQTPADAASKPEPDPVHDPGQEQHAESKGKVRRSFFSSIGDKISKFMDDDFNTKES